MIWWILLGIGLLLLIPTGYAAKIGAPYAPTFQKAIDQAFDDLQIGEGDVIIDLGAGDGKVLLAAQARGAKAIGYELSPIMWLIASFRLWLASRKQDKSIRPQLHFANFFKAKLPPDATHIFVFLMPEHMEKLRRYLKAQHLPQAQALLSYMFPVKSLEPDAVIRPHKAGHVYVYDWQKITK